MNSIDMHYIGVCNLLSRVVDPRHVSETDMILVKSALEDCAAAYPGRFEVVKTTSGYSLEPVEIT